jgi:hypothetical protein
VLLDRAPTGEAPSTPGLAGEEHVRVRRLLTHMAAAEPHRYVVVDADGPADEVAERVAAGLTPLLPPAPVGEAVTAPTPLPQADQRTVAVAASLGHAHPSADTASYPTALSAACQPGEMPLLGPSRSSAGTGPIRRVEPTGTTRSAADTAPFAAARPPLGSRDRQPGAREGAAGAPNSPGDHPEVAP